MISNEAALIVAIVVTVIVGFKWIPMLLADHFTKRRQQKGMREYQRDRNRMIKM